MTSYETLNSLVEMSGLIALAVLGGMVAASVIHSFFVESMRVNSEGDPASAEDTRRMDMAYRAHLAFIACRNWVPVTGGVFLLLFIAQKFVAS